MTRIRHSEKVFIVKRLLLILILTLSFQTWTKADDIKDFEVEGISIGDSLLGHMSKREIKENYIDYGGVKKFYATNYNKDLSKFYTIINENNSTSHHRFNADLELNIWHMK